MLVVVAGSSASAVDLDHWGMWADGVSEDESLRTLSQDAHDRFASFLAAHGAVCSPADDWTVLERCPEDDEGVFEVERQPATDADRERTLQLYRWARRDLVRLIDEATDDELDWVDVKRRLPDWAWWHSARQMAWHCAITESCYYLGRLGVPRPAPFAALASPNPAPSTAALLDALGESQAHVETWIAELPPDVTVETDGEVWTTRKSLRRIAGHERAENDVTAELLRRAAVALGSQK